MQGGLDQGRTERAQAERVPLVSWAKAERATVVRYSWRMGRLGKFT